VLLATGMAALYHYVPNTRVKWVHAWSGAIFVAVAFEVAKWLLGYYLRSVPTYSAVYGAFATAPILLLWIYIAWVIVLFGAVIAAYLPSLLQGVKRRGGTPGWSFTLAIEVMQALHAARATPAKGLTLSQITAQLMVDDLQLSRPMQSLRELDWIAVIESDADNEGGTQRWILLAQGDEPLQPLIDKLLLHPTDSLEFMQKKGDQPIWNLRSVLSNR
jgi:membrane protein